MNQKISNGIQTLLVDSELNMPFYGNFNLFINFKEDKTIPTCGVNITSGGMNFFYNTLFLDRITQKETNFIILHENFHLLWEHNKRTSLGYYNFELSNIAQDMIINHILVRDISFNFIDIPKNEKGENIALFIPKDYEGNLIFEELYLWLLERKSEYDKNKNNKDKFPTSDNYGNYGKDPNGDGTIDTYSLDYVFKNLDINGGQYLDSHISDEVTQDVRKEIVRDTFEKLKNRGYLTKNIEKSLLDLKKSKKDYLSYIKRTISNEIIGKIKKETITKINRRNLFGIKGKKKVTSKINVILDTSGSMSFEFEKVLSYINRKDIQVNLIQCDTEVKKVKLINNCNINLKKLKIKGLGGTIIQPAIDLVSEKYNNYNTLLLTDGYTDVLDLSKIKGKLLVLTTGKEVKTKSYKKNVKQISI